MKFALQSLLLAWSLLVTAESDKAALTTCLNNTLEQHVQEVTASFDKKLQASVIINVVDFRQTPPQNSLKQPLSCPVSCTLVALS
jgi:hypothetical protein